MNYKVTTANELSYNDIAVILKGWSIEEWKSLSSEQFKTMFKESEFHLLYEGEQLVSLLRINTNFVFTVSEQEYQIPEMVGLVSIVQGKGYGKELLSHVQSNLKSRNLECIGFCFEHNRGFYDKCGITVYEGCAKYFQEKNREVWVDSEDDDVLDINLSPSAQDLIKSLSADKKAFLKEVKEVATVSCAI